MIYLLIPMAWNERGWIGGNQERDVSYETSHSIRLDIVLEQSMHRRKIKTLMGVFNW